MSKPIERHPAYGYPAAVKAEILQEVKKKKKPISRIAQEHGIANATLHSWLKVDRLQMALAKQEAIKAIPDTSTPHQSFSRAAHRLAPQLTAPPQLNSEIETLRTENKKLRGILFKFSELSLSAMPIVSNQG